MAVLDTLEILIEADSRGLETQLKRAGQTITQFVDKMNSQEVNWQSILAGSLDTAIIAGIASSFAVAITQAMQFQDSMLNVSNNTSAAFGSSSDAMVNLAGTTGASLADTTAAYNAFYKQLSGISDIQQRQAAAQQLAGMAGQLALISNQSLSELMPQLISLFNQWGINTLPKATDALTGLANEAGKGQFSLGELISTIANQGPILQGTTNISAMAVQLQALSNQAGMSKTTVVDTFNAIAQGVANPIDQINLLNGGVGAMARDLKKPDGLIQAFSDVSTTIKKAGAAGATLATQMGIPLTSAAQLANQTADAFKATKDAADAATAAMKPFSDVVESLLSVTDRLSQDFQKLIGILTKNVGMPILEGLDALLKDINGMLSGSFLKSFGDIFNNLILKNPLAGQVGSIATAGAGLIGDTLKNLMNIFGGGTLAPTNPVSNAVPSTGYGPVSNAPTQNSTSQKTSNVTLNNTINVSGAGGNAKAIGSNISDQLYNNFMGNPLLQL